MATIEIGFKTLVPDPHRFEGISVVAYLAMGWMTVFILPDIIEHVALEGILMIIVSSFCYSFWIIFYKMGFFSLSIMQFGTFLSYIERICH